MLSGKSVDFFQSQLGPTGRRRAQSGNYPDVDTSGIEGLITCQL